MDDLYLMTVFVAVGEEMSFAAAARRLDISTAAVTRAVNYLESKRGATLLQRSTRGITLSSAGQRYLVDARSILAMVTEAEETAIGGNIVARGHLRVTAPVLFGRLFIIPGIVAYLQKYPETEISAIFLDRAVNLIDEGFDVAIRIGQLPDSSMKALRVGTVRRIACASPAYLALHGIPGSPADLQRHRIVATEVSVPSIAWTFQTGRSQTTIKLKPVLGVSGSDAAINAALLGAGIVYLPSYQVAGQVEAGELIAILEEYACESLPIHLLHRENRFGSSKVRSFIDLLGAHIRSQNLSH